MGLSTYKKKRNFSQTKEPEGKLKNADDKCVFVVQRHKASHLHYDFRLELNGVLVSWAVPKGPSMNPEDKRLAMKVEDHPYEYKDFKGKIPEGNYGAGIVEIWDKGYYTNLEGEDKIKTEKSIQSGLKSGSIKVNLHGKKLKGEFALVKIKPREGQKDNSWLLIKHNDQYAVHIEYNSENKTAKSSPINKLLAKEKIKGK